MVQVSYPGVYIQEVSSGVKTITGVSTSITAFFGRANKGPLNRAVRCLSYADFVRNFGGSPAESELALSVKQFYDNGGTDCYVVRLARDARRAAVQINNYAGTPVLVASAKAEGLWGNALRLEVDYDTVNPGETFNLSIIQEEAGRVVATEAYSGLSMDYTSSRFAPTFVSQSSALIDLALASGLGNATNPGSVYQTSTAGFNGFSEARRRLADDGDPMDDVAAALVALLATQYAFEISVDNSPWVGVSLQGLASTGATLVADLTARINDALSVLSPAPTVTVQIRSDGFAQFLRVSAASGNHASVRVRRAAANDLAAALMFGADNGGIELSRWSNLRPAATGSVSRIGTTAMGLEGIDAITDLTQATITDVTVGSDAAIPLNAAPNNLVTAPPGTNPWIMDAVSGSVTGNNDGVREKLRIIASAITNAATGHYTAEVHGYQLAIYPKSGTFNERPATIAFAGSAALAPTINVRQYKLGFDGATGLFATGGSLDPASGAFTNADDGDDGIAPDYATYVGDPVRHTGFYALDTVDLFNLMVLPRDEGVTAAHRLDILGPASIYCRSRRAFLIVEAPDNWTGNSGLPDVVNNTALIEDVRARVVKDHSAVFYPKVRVNDAGVLRTVGAGGAIAGLMARTDASRGVWKAPAGTEADLRALSGLAVKLTDLENGVLNKLGVNCARSFISGFVNWGARTLEGADDLGSEWKYIPIRRLALFLEESLYRGTQWVVFEPNDEPLWAKIRLNVGAFMNGLFRQGAFQGSSPGQAYYVKCDAETTTQADRNLGIVNIEVGFAPLKPAEFVVIKIQQIAGDLS